MNQNQRDIQCKLRILKHAEDNGHVARTCRYFGVARASFYRWKSLYKKEGEAGLVNKKPIPKNPTNRTPPEVVEKVLHLRPTYHLGPIRIVGFARREFELQGQAMPVHTQMQLGCQPASAATDMIISTLFFGAAACW